MSLQSFAGFITEQLKQSNWSIYYIRDYLCHAEGCHDLVDELSLKQALEIIAVLPVKSENSDPETDLTGGEFIDRGPFLAFGSPRNAHEECGMWVSEPTFVFTKEQALNLAT